MPLQINSFYDYTCKTGGVGGGKENIVSDLSHQVNVFNYDLNNSKVILNVVLDLINLK